MFDDLFTPTIGEVEETGALRSALLDVLFDQMPIGMAVIDRNMTLLRVNPTWRAFLQRYAPLSNPQVREHTNLFDLFPGEAKRFTPILNDAFNGTIVRREALAMYRDGVTSYWDVVVNPLRQDGAIQTLLIVVIDASDRVFANRLLEEKEAQYRGIFEATSDGVIIHAAGGRIVEANPAACAMHGYSYDEMIGIHSERLFNPEAFQDALKRVLAGEAVDIQSVNTRKNGQPFDVEIRATRFTYRGEPHMLSVVRDVTERVQAFQMLEQRVEERTHELSTLLQASNNITSTLELEPLLNEILNEIKAVIDYNGAAIYTLHDEDRLDLLLYRGPIPQSELRHEWPLERDFGFGRVIYSQAPVIVADVEANTLPAQQYREQAGEHVRYVRSWMGIPLIVRQRVIGMLGFDSDTANRFTDHMASLAMAFANQAAVAMDNARLYEAEQDRLQETERRRRVAEGLRDILNILNSNRSLDAILDYIVAQAGRLLGTETIALFGFHPDQEILTVETSIGLEENLTRGFIIHAGRGEVGRAIRERRPAIIPNLAALELAPNDEQRPVVERWVKRFTALLAVPVIAREQLYGAIMIYYPQAHDFTNEEIQLVVTVCDQAALAIENAHLREQAEHAAVAAERSRIARELHDAVTQTLFSASLIAEVLPRLWERDPHEAQRRLSDLREMTRGALAEMRALLLELRPATLTEVELRDLLRQLCEAHTGRARIPCHLEVEGQPHPLPPDTQLVFYRVAQEALNNIFKHANASDVDLQLGYSANGVSLSISDNGRGFDPGSVSAESFGLKIMRERAESIGASFAVSTQPEHGTRISLRWTEGDRHE
ncbi:MAG TPA: GAF domain-containing protein [Phototrophicaceae bacterium]|nr:GAF domain-containing protein [Phototrophicaceae bacterium]